MRWVKDGVIVPLEGYTVSGRDPGLLVGMSVFETMRTYAGRVFRLGAHLARLQGSAQALGVPWLGAEAVAREVAVATEGLPAELGVRVTLTAGGTRLIQATPLDHGLVERPLRVVTRVWEPPVWLNGRVKHASRAASEVARTDAHVDEVFWVGLDGMVTEATRSSVFAVIDGVLITPPDDGRILSGVTRAALLDAAAVIGLETAERGFAVDAPFTELYASSTLKELSAVIELDGRPLPGAGPVGRAVVLAFRALVARECTA
jgi:branched-chain amino acid aminotransferase